MSTLRRGRLLHAPTWRIRSAWRIPLILIAASASAVAALPAADAAPWDADVFASIAHHPPRHPGKHPSNCSGGHVSPIYYHMRGRETFDDPDLPEALLHRFMELHTSMDYLRATEVAMRLADLLPENPIVHYNLACSLARLNRLDESLDALERAVERGWRRLAHTRIDTDLQPVRWMPRYRAIVQRMADLIESERIRPEPLRTDHWLTVVMDIATQTPVMLDRYQVPGASVALIRNGKMVWSGAFGVRERFAVCPSSEGPPALREDDLIPVRGPLHLLAAMGVLQDHVRGRARLAELFRHAEGDRSRVRHAARPLPPVRATLSSASPLDGSSASSRVARGGESSHSMDRIATPAPRQGEAQVYTSLRMASERAMGRPFADFCREHAFEPTGMSHTTFQPNEMSQRAVSPGHTRLGTPRHMPASQRGEIAYTTASDLGLLLEAVIAAQRAGDIDDGGPALDRGARRLSLLAAMGAPPSGFALSASSGPAGLRLEVAEQSGGTGCLMRWYPETGDGIVILYNGETGEEAAARIAHLALGGP
ncbi:MAG TPA: serine hydrolase [Phycisphaerales bacterium]|nr:serine hydrolase [Phycisphaerales bacterium]HRQ76863.1 serine hydrolase [Phycisphaerales bacterium]